MAIEAMVLADTHCHVGMYPRPEEVLAQAHAVVLLERIEEAGELQTMSAVMESQRQLEDVVRDLVSQVHGVAAKVPFDTEDIT